MNHQWKESSNTPSYKTIMLQLISLAEVTILALKCHAEKARKKIKKVEFILS